MKKHPRTIWNFSPSLFPSSLLMMIPSCPPPPLPKAQQPLTHCLRTDFFAPPAFGWSQGRVGGDFDRWGQRWRFHGHAVVGQDIVLGLSLLAVGFRGFNLLSVFRLDLADLAVETQLHSPQATLALPLTYGSKFPLFRFLS